MKKLALFLGIMLVAGLGFGAVNAPLNTTGDQLNSIDWVGADTCNIDYSTAAFVPILCEDEAVVVYGVVITSAPTTTFIVMRDTSVATINAVAATKTIVGAATYGGSAMAVNVTHTVKFPVPIKFNYGLSVNVSATPTIGGSVWTILYRKRSATE